jgi:S1-C subfamily serine protease
MDFLRKALQKSWFLLVPVTILGMFLIYILFPGVRLTHQDNERLVAMRAEKEQLNSSLQYLTLQSEAAVCVGEELVIPSGNIHDVMPPQNANGVVEKLEESVVLILSKNGDDVAFGSGFFVTPSKVVTNGHVVQGFASTGSKVLVVNASIGVQRARILDIQFSGDYAEDFALLTIDEPVGKPLTLVNIQSPSNYKLEQVFAAGFPGAVIESDAEFIKLFELGEFSVPDLVITDGTISSHQKVFGEVSAFVHTAQISGGSSGGPLVNKCGNVIGINTFINNSIGGVRNFSLISSELLQFLSRSMVAPRVTAGECK